MALIHWIYASAETAPFSPADLSELLQKARANNEGHEITGLLLYHQGSFLQVLEGEEDQVAAVVGRIERDQRHERLRLLYRGEIEQRSFGEWRMGFCKPARAEEIPGFVDMFRTLSTAKLDLVESGHRVAKLIDAFKDGRWRQKVAA
jgi:hypothetical protein